MTAPHPPHYTSVPAWARTPAVEPADPSGRSHTLLEVGEDPATAPVVAAWLDELGGLDRLDGPTAAVVRRHRCAGQDAAVAALEDDLATARVGHRLLVTGSADDCLAVRAAAVRAGLGDDEMRFGVVSVHTRTVWCVHCSAATQGGLALEDVVACSGCARSLVVYPHVSRRTGRHLGFMADAEAPA